MRTPIRKLRLAKTTLKALSASTLNTVVGGQTGSYLITCKNMSCVAL